MIELKKRPVLEFDGQPIGQCKRFVQKREAKLGVFAGTIGVCLVGIPVIIVLIGVPTLNLAVILGICIPIMIAYPTAIGLYPLTKGAESSILPSKIVFHENGHMESISKSFHWVKMVDNVAQVIDWGAWYEIKFIPSEKNPRFICQKDLLTVGTIEDFEKLFEGKLIRK